MPEPILMDEWDTFNIPAAYARYTGSYRLRVSVSAGEGIVTGRTEKEFEINAGLNYMVRKDGAILEENGEVPQGSWMTVTPWDNPALPDVEDSWISYSMFVFSGSPDGDHQEIGHLVENEQGDYCFPAIGEPGSYYVQIWADFMAPDGDDGVITYGETIKEYFGFTVVEGPEQEYSGEGLYFPDAADGKLTAKEPAVLRAYMNGAEYIKITTATQDGEPVGAIAFDGFAGEGTWRANKPGTYTLTLKGYTYVGDTTDLEELEGRTATCTVTVLRSTGLDYTVRTDDGELQENGTVAQGEWLTVQIGDDPWVPELDDDYSVYYSVFLYSHNPEGPDREIGCLAENEGRKYSCPAVGGPGDYYFQVFASVMRPSGDGDSETLYETIQGSFDFTVESSGQDVPGAMLYFPGIDEGEAIPAKKPETLRLYGPGAENIIVTTENEAGEVIGTIQFDGFAGERTWRAEEPGTYTLTLQGYRYPGETTDIEELEGCTATCTVTVESGSIDWNITDLDDGYGYYVLDITGNGEIPDYDADHPAPWTEDEHGNEIDRVIIREGIFSIGANAFAGMENDVPVRVDFYGETKPEIDEHAFAGTTAVCRYYSDDASWPAEGVYGNLTWVRLPFHDDDQEVFGYRLWYNDDEGWLAMQWSPEEGEYVMIPVSASHAAELSCHWRNVFLQDMPSEGEFDMMCGNSPALWDLKFEPGCAGTVTLDVPKKVYNKTNITCASGNMNLTVNVAEGGQVSNLSVDDGTVVCNGDVEHLQMFIREVALNGDVTLTGNVDSLQIYGTWDEENGKYIYRGALTLQGTVASGVVYGQGDIRVWKDQTKDPIHFDQLVIAMIDDFIAEEPTVILANGELNADVGGACNWEDVYAINYSYYRAGDRPGVWSVCLMAKELEVDSTVIVELENFSHDQIIYGNAELTLEGWGMDSPMILNGEPDGEGNTLGLRSLSVRNSAVVVNCPVDYLVTPYYGQDCYDLVINDRVGTLWLGGELPQNKAVLGDNGSIGEGYFSRLMRPQYYYGPVQGPMDPLFEAGKLNVPYHKKGQTLSYIFPSDSELALDAGLDDGLYAAMDLEQLGTDTLSVKELELLNLGDGERVAAVADITVTSYRLDSEGNPETQGPVTSLDEPTKINLTAEGDTEVYRLHQEGSNTYSVDKLDTTPDGTNGTIQIETDRFSKYVLVDPDGGSGEDQQLDYTVYADDMVLEENGTVQQGQWIKVQIGEDPEAPAEDAMISYTVYTFRGGSDGNYEMTGRIVPDADKTCYIPVTEAPGKYHLQIEAFIEWFGDDGQYNYDDIMEYFDYTIEAGTPLPEAGVSFPYAVDGTVEAGTPETVRAYVTGAQRLKVFTTSENGEEVAEMDFEGFSASGSWQANTPGTYTLTVKGYTLEPTGEGNQADWAEIPDRSASCTVTVLPSSGLNYTVLADGAELTEDGTVDQGSWMTVRVGADPRVPDVEDYSVSYSMFLCSGTPDGAHRQIGHLDDNGNREYGFPAIGTPGSYYVQIWATIMVPDGEGGERPYGKTMKEYFEFHVAEGSEPQYPEARVFFPGYGDEVTLEAGQSATVCAYMNGAEHISITTATDGSGHVPSIGFDGFAGEGTWRADKRGTYTLTLTGYTYDDPEGILVPMEGTATCTVTVTGGIPDMEEPTFVTPSALTEIEADAFAGVQARVVKITGNVTKIGRGAFAGAGTEQLIVLNKDTDIAAGAFDGCANLEVFGQPGGAVEDWAEDNGIPFYPIPED